MAWQLFRVAYELRSPLHIGYHKIGNVQRTRYYIPSRNLWGAVTERLTRSGFQTDSTQEGSYEKIGEWVQKHIAFSYFFVQEGDQLLYPHYTETGLCYGQMLVTEFERRYLSAHVTTALEAATTSVEQGSLHEVEFIAPQCCIKQNGGEHVGRMKIGGWVFLKAESMDLLGDETNWRRWLGELWVGGERRYGFGHLRLAEQGWQPNQPLPPGYTPECDGDRPSIRVEKGKPLLAHTEAQGVQACGQIEPLVGRETRGDSAHFGHTLTQAQVCWTPGSVVENETQVTVEATGIWRLAVT